MRAKIICIITTILLITVTLFNTELIPLRREISDIEVVMVAGLDKTETGYEMSYLKGDEMKMENSNSGKETLKVISIDADNYNFDMRHIQTTTDKYITSSHIQYYFIGEETAKTDFYHVIDAIVRGYQTRLNARIYVVKGATAKEFLEKAASSDYKLEDKLELMQNDFWAQRVSMDIEVLDVVKTLFTKEGIGMIPLIEFTDYLGAFDEKVEEYDSMHGGESVNNISTEHSGIEETHVPFSYAGVGIIKDMQMVDMLTEKETMVANYILSKNNASEISIKNKDTFVSFGIDTLNVKEKFKFNNKDILEEIIFEVTFDANYEEVKALEPVFTLAKVEEYEKQLNDVVKKQVEDILKLELEKGMDFLALKGKLEFKHPYRYRKNESNFMDILKNCKITVESKGKIEATYDVVESNYKQKGWSK